MNVMLLEDACALRFNVLQSLMETWRPCELMWWKSHFMSWNYTYMDIFKMTSRMTVLKLFCLTAGTQRSPPFLFAISRGPRVLILYCATFKEGGRNGFPSARTDVSHVTNTLQHVEVLLVKLKTLPSECFLSLWGVFLYTLSFNMPHK
jgi:hypothetical protein